MIDEKKLKDLLYYIIKEITIVKVKTHVESFTESKPDEAVALIEGAIKEE